MVTTLAVDAGLGSTIARGVGAILLYAVVGLLLMVIGFFAIDWTTPGKLTALVREGRPNAVVITSAGLLSMAFIVVVAIFNATDKLGEGLLSALVFGLVGILVQVAAVRVLEAVARLSIGDVLAAERFAPVSAVVATAHLALGLVVAVAIS